MAIPPWEDRSRPRLERALEQARIAFFAYQPDWSHGPDGLHGELHWCGAHLGIDGFDGAEGLASVLLAVVEPDRRTFLHIIGLDRPASSGSGEFRVKQCGGGTIDLSCDTQMELDADGRVGAVSGVLKDITERRRMLGGMAHEINNLLQPVALLGRHMLDRNLVAAEGVSYLEVVLDCCRKAGHILGDVLAFSRRARRRGTVENMGHLVDECLRLLVLTLPKDVVVVVREPHIPLTVFVDRTAFAKVLLNIATNGAAAMDDRGELVIALDGIRQSDGVAFARLRIIDTGHGMDPDTMKRAFEPFFTTRPVGQGTGLGLSVAQAMVTEMSGTIMLDSTQGKGTTVTVLLPVHQGDSRNGLDSVD